METRQLKQIIRQELPEIIRRDRAMQKFIVELAREQFADKQETNSRFDQVLQELRRDREEQSRKWDEQNRKWEEQNRKWDENQQTLARDREEQNRKWDENQKEIRQLFESLRGLHRQYDQTIGALGARWGLHTEQSFRNALKGILGDSFGVQVLNVVEYDESGEVFGQPDQVELDLVIQNGMLIICEIKSSMSKADMLAFSRKAKFYEKRHQRQAARLLVISPMVDAAAQAAASKLGIQIYSFAEDVDPNILTQPPE